MAIVMGGAGQKPNDPNLGPEMQDALMNVPQTRISDPGITPIPSTARPQATRAPKLTRKDINFLQRLRAYMKGDNPMVDAQSTPQNSLQDRLRRQAQPVQMQAQPQPQITTDPITGEPLQY